MIRRHERLLFAAGFAALLGACAEPSPPEPVVRPVRSVVVEAASAERSRSFSGVARAGVESTLSFRVTGAVSRVAVRIGDSVEEGALLAELDPVDYGLQVREAEAGLRQAEARARNADAELRRVRNLFENDGAARTDLDAALSAADSAKALAEAEAQRLDLARRRLGFVRLTAPFSGAVAALHVEENENVSPGAPVMTLAGEGAAEVGFAVPEALIREIRAGMPATIRFDAIPDEEFEGVVTEVGVASTAVGTTFPVTVRVAGEQEEVRSGMAAVVGIVFAEETSGPLFILPGHAVGEDRTGRFVFVAQPTGDGLATVRKRPVTVAGFAAGGIGVTRGVENGDHVVTAGLGRLQDGDIVRLVPDGVR